MGIWIRNQDKSVLCLVDNAWIKYKEVGTLKSDYDVRLGEYNSEDEAMQVLDMIEGRIKDNACTELAGTEYNGYIRPVFQMPPAGFSENGGADDVQP